MKDNVNDDISYEKVRSALNTTDSTNKNRRLLNDVRTKQFGELKFAVNEKKKQIDQHIEHILDDGYLTSSSSISSENSKTNNFDYPQIFID
ncbi:unnamed protein product [Adineta steineri]|uniref:Uncharacterized protein n=1 Tax=Adineta steineri TaxID=433720 RepID=A0A819MHK2_9BILA|nr:unnamed protein product [Adineta steineri]